MTFNYGLEKKKFDEAWAALRKYYQECGMDPESIEKMHEFDWDQFKAARIEAMHTQEMTVPADADEDDDLAPQLTKKFPEQFTTSYDTFGSHNRYWWLEELNNPCLAFGARLLTSCEKEILTLYIVDQLTMEEIAARMRISKNAVKKQLHKVFSYFPETP